MAAEPQPTLSLFLFKQRFGKSVGVKGLKIVRLFAHADKFNRNAKLLFYSYDNAAPGGAVQLCKHNAGNSACRAEFPCLIKGILPRRCVKHKQGFNGGACGFSLDNSADFRKLVHKPFFVMKAPCGIADYYIRMASLSRGNGVKYNRRRV